MDKYTLHVNLSYRYVTNRFMTYNVLKRHDFPPHNNQTRPTVFFYNVLPIEFVVFIKKKSAKTSDLQVHVPRTSGPKETL